MTGAAQAMAKSFRRSSPKVRIITTSA